MSVSGDIERMNQPATETADVVLIGAGVMSATLAVLLKELDPEAKVEIVEQLDGAASESSFAWNNAGTGHAALCELNYTPRNKDGSISIEKAVRINTAFEESKQFWSYLIEQGAIESARRFLNPVPHMSFVRGAKDVEFLRKRFEAMSAHPCFADMRYSESPEQIAEWAPLLMRGRKGDDPIAATRVDQGTDVDFGALTRQLLRHLDSLGGARVSYKQRVASLEREANGDWLLELDVDHGKRSRQLRARFVFVGAGGGALPLLQKSGIPEAQGYAGFPVSGQWLRCDDPKLVAQHKAKVYSQASVGAPPMSVPHLDTRVVDGRSSLLFGPFAGFTTKFLKTGSPLDLPLSVRADNLRPMLSVARDNFSLVKYLVGQVLQTPKQRIEALREFFPEASEEDWRLEIAGQRVQIIKRDAKRGGKLEFGTELVTAADGSLAALLGASPGASTAVSTMLQLIERCFPERYQSEDWQSRLGAIFTARAGQLAQDGKRLAEVRERTHRVLELTPQPAQA
ncbi:malate dehydrogenase (quinone) [Halotalea alkalilenta]